MVNRQFALIPVDEGMLVFLDNIGISVYYTRMQI